MSRYRANRLIQRMCRLPETIARLNSEPEKVFDEFGLDEEDKQALRDGGMAAMGRVGIHPILQMHWLFARDPDAQSSHTIGEYPDLLED